MLYRVKFIEDDKRLDEIIRSMQIDHKNLRVSEEILCILGAYNESNLAYRKIVVDAEKTPNNRTIRVERPEILYRTRERIQILLIDATELSKIPGIKIRKIVCDTNYRFLFKEIKRKKSGNPPSYHKINEEFAGDTDLICFTFEMSNRNRTDFNFEFYISGKNADETDVELLTDPQVGNDPP